MFEFYHFTLIVVLPCCAYPLIRGIKVQVSRVPVSMTTSTSENVTIDTKGNFLMLDGTSLKGTG